MGIKQLIKNIAHVINKPFGEMARLEGGSAEGYKLDSSSVDKNLARTIYDNNDDRYKLAPFAKPIVNSTLGFIGIPCFSIEDEEAQQILDKFMENNKSKIMQIIQESLLVGDSFLCLSRGDIEEDPLNPDQEPEVKSTVMPAEQINDIILNLKNEEIGYILKSDLEWLDIETLEKKKAKVTQVITKDVKKIEVEGDTNEELQNGQEVNNWGFIPIIHFKNEPDITKKYGKSEIEFIEPFLKAYHDVFMHAMKGSKMHSNPKLKLKIEDVESFLANNFGIDDPTKFIKEGKKLNFEGKEVLFLQGEDDASFIEVSSATGDAEILIKLLFYCLIDISETPEFVFGVHISGALASVKEQMPIVIQKTGRKRLQLSDSFSEMAKKVLAMESIGTGHKFSSYDIKIVWEEVDKRDEQEVANTISTLANGLDKAIVGGFCSVESAVDFLKDYIHTMQSYNAGEKEKIMQSKEMNINDGVGQRFNIEKDKLNNNLEDDSETEDEDE